MCIWSISGCAIDLLRNLWYYVAFPAHWNWQLVANSSKMFNKPHVRSFLALPLYPCGCEPETHTTPPPVWCSFACVLCAHVCSRFHISLSCCRVSWRNLCWPTQSNLKLSFERGGKNPTSLLWRVKVLLCSGAVLPGREKELSWWIRATNISVPAQMPKLVRKRGQLAVPLDIGLICGVAIGIWMPAAVIKVRYCCYALKEKKNPK